MLLVRQPMIAAPAGPVKKSGMIHRKVWLISERKYLAGMGFAQPLHFPRSRSHPRIGMFSLMVRVLPHSGQTDRVFWSDREIPFLAHSTVAKDPVAAPMRIVPITDAIHTMK